MIVIYCIMTICVCISSIITCIIAASIVDIIKCNNIIYFSRRNLYRSLYKLLDDDLRLELVNKSRFID